MAVTKRHKTAVRDQPLGVAFFSKFTIFGFRVASVAGLRSNPPPMQPELPLPDPTPFNRPDPYMVRIAPPRLGCRPSLLLLRLEPRLALNSYSYSQSLSTSIRPPWGDVQRGECPSTEGGSGASEELPKMQGKVDRP